MEIDFQRSKERKYRSDRFGELVGTSGQVLASRSQEKIEKTKENRSSKGWLGEVPGASTDSGVVRLGSTLREILSREPRPPPHFAKKELHVTPKVQSQVQSWIL